MLQNTDETRKMKMLKYVVTFELNEWAKGTQNEEEFIPVLICREHELHEIMDMPITDCEAHIVNIRPATEEDIANYPHYYC